jgi:hypothetical protein
MYEAVILIVMEISTSRQCAIFLSIVGSTHHPQINNGKMVAKNVLSIWIDTGL